MPKTELLAPAGNYDAFLAALYGGCDAVYLGIKNFGARAFCDNFDLNTLAKTIKLAHLNNVKIYVTLNTLIMEEEMKACLKAVDELYKLGVDAILLQDLGLAYRIKERYPDLELHASTQMNINDPKALDFLKQFGFSRVVIARESSLKTIKTFAEGDLEIEAFVHGALCVSYSGACLLSSALDQRSGNRGICAQFCRMRYEVFDIDTNEVLSKPAYFLSPKDLNSLENLPELVSSKVASIKIEGRMKSSAYVYLVTRLYRECLDTINNHEDVLIDKDLLDELKIAYNRQFNSGYAFDFKNETFFNRESPKHQGLYLGKCNTVKGSHFEFKIQHDLKFGDALRFVNENEECGYITNEIYIKGKLFKSAKKGEVVTLPLKRDIGAPFKVYLTKTATLIQNIRPKLDLKMTLRAHIDDFPSLEISYEGYKTRVFSKERAQRAQNQVLDYEGAYKQLSKLNDTPYTLAIFGLETNGVFMNKRALNSLRRKALKILNILRLSKKRVTKPSMLKKCAYQKSTYRLMVEVSSRSQYLLLKDYEGILFVSSDKALCQEFKDINYIGPLVNEEGLLDKDVRVASQVGDILSSKIAYYTLNITNTETIALFRSLGYSDMILSSELNTEQLNSIKDHLDDYSGLYYLCYGKRDLMYLKSDPVYDFKGNLALRDMNKRTFRLKKDKHGITHLLENEAVHRPCPYFLKPFWRLTYESEKEVQALIWEYL